MLGIVFLLIIKNNLFFGMIEEQLIIEKGCTSMLNIPLYEPEMSSAMNNNKGNYSY